ncbi:MAG: MFS transporter [Candidatus Dormibacteraeota bacterium]|nr:MFS transporter [Candidatus Dormibacteraeota bacterium]
MGGQRRGAAEGPAPAPSGVDWKRNLGAIWVAEFFAMFGFSFAMPFLALYLHQDLGVHDKHQLSLWVGVASGASGLAMAVAGPIWGGLADRHGRRPMLIRAMLGGAVCIGLLAFVRAPWELVALRVAQGLTSGTVAAATALVASETPRRRVAAALGILAAGFALGEAIGPVAGGLATAFFGFRPVFLGTTALLLLAILPVLLVVRESPRPAPAPAPVEGARRRPRTGLAAIPRAVLLTLLALVIAQSLVQFAYVGSQQMVSLRLIAIVPGDPNLATGIAFACAGVATAIAASMYGPLSRRFGYRRLAGSAAVLFGLAILVAALAPSLAPLVFGVAAYGFFFGCVNPSLSTLIGLHTPRAVQARVYGVSGSATSVGWSTGPLLAGVVAAAFSPQAAMLVTAAAALVPAAVVWFAVRDPGDAEGGRERASGTDPVPESS